MKYRFHVFGLPHTETIRQYCHCAYTEKVRKFCNMMISRGHEVFLYGGQENEAKCTEFISCISKKEQFDLIGIEKPTDNLKAQFNSNTDYWQLFNSRCIEEARKRMQPKDFICVIAGLRQKPISDAFPETMTVEYGIGYGGTFSKFRVFESYAWMHTVYGSQSSDAHGIDGNFFDSVIPNYYELADFPLVEHKQNYFLFIGRLIERKGYKIALDVCKRLGKRLVVAGQGEAPEGTDYRGVVGVEERGNLMSNASAVFVPTQYIEPFGGVAVEAQLCGTPVITTDWGAFVETVIHGKTGYRCRTLQDFINAANNLDGLSTPKEISEHAAMNYGTVHVAKLYEQYFDRLYSLWGDGWYQVDRLSDNINQYGVVYERQ